MLVWTDLETTGLEPREGDVLEVALVVTDDDLREAAAMSVVIRPDDWEAKRARLSPFIVDMHAKNGLLWEVDISPYGPTVATKMVHHFLDQVAALNTKETPLAGSTIGFDRAWLKEHLPSVEARFHYRSVDVSSFNEVAKRWTPDVYERRPKANAAHRALADVRESIDYLRYYRQCGFFGSGGTR